jgi:hypothetical protein
VEVWETALTRVSFVRAFFCCRRVVVGQLAVLLGCSSVLLGLFVVSVRVVICRCVVVVRRRMMMGGRHEVMVDVLLGRLCHGFAFLAHKNSVHE